MDFNYGNENGEGYRTNSRNSLNSITMDTELGWLRVTKGEGPLLHYSTARSRRISGMSSSELS